jgi:uncharacterized iron-regulated protein
MITQKNIRLILAFMLVLGVLFNNYTSWRNYRTIQKADTNEKEVIRLEERFKSQTDSLEAYRKRTNTLLKIIVVQEQKIKNPPDEKEIYNAVATLDDSTAHRLFNELFDTNGLFDLSK